MPTGLGEGVQAVPRRAPAGSRGSGFDIPFRGSDEKPKKAINVSVRVKFWRSSDERKEKLMSVEENKSLVRNLLEDVYCRGVNKLDDYVAEDYVDHSKIRSREGLKKALADHQATFSPSCVIEQIIGEGDMVAVAARFTLRKKGAPDKTFSITSILRIEKGKVVEAWPHSDIFF
jgi:predicted SnoaL-like aldol condensation-catalyzing enzyme